MYMARLQQPAQQNTHAAGAVHVGSDETTRWFQVSQQGSVLADFLEIVNLQGHASFSRDGQQMQNRVGRAAGCRDTGDGVLKSRPSQNVPGNNSPAQQIQDQFAALKSNLILLWIHGGNAVEAMG